MRNLFLAVAISTALLAGFGMGVAIVNAQSGATEELPAYHANPPALPLPATLDPNTFPDAENQKIYALAAKEKPVLYQQPCYCHCDRSQGHESLLDCFVSKHGAGCETCVREDLYSYEQTHKGKTPTQIRAGIIQGEWQSVDISKYQTPPVAHK